MNIQQDWFMRQIENMIRFVSQVVFRQDVVQYDIANDQELSDIDLVHLRLLELLTLGKICEAENYLFVTYRGDNTASIKVAIDFYQRLNELSDETLVAHNFSRDEIDAGLRDLLKISNIDTFGS